MADHTITVMVVHAGVDRQIARQVELPVGSTVMQAIDASRIIELIPDGALDPHRLGIFAQRVSPDQLLHDGDRIEIYRPLLLDPMEARRRRAC